ncbi:MAG: hypothetical protein KGJ58_04335 [Patescibacteria group bacterium]|nr:hypothetical protein [Patescibacteria group bacterium]MDE1988338.1 hypothetical protein [Patescibacteria group bacterium]MDE2218645.1 hypothetical protein [Patescibacteria group bacterium]
MVSPQIAKLMASLKPSGLTDGRIDKDEFYVKVNDLAKRAGMFYEKIRYLIDYKEEHTIRRNAIQRILKRNLFFKTEGKTAQFLVHELVRGGYLESGSFLESRISYVQGIIDKFLFLQNFLIRLTERNLAINKEIISLAASEIEIYLFGSKIEESVFAAFYETVKDNIKFSQIPINSDDKDTQTYIACLRSFLKADEQTIAYRLWLRFLPNWIDVKNASEVQEAAKNFPSVQSKIVAELYDNLSWKIARKLKNQAIYFSLIKEIIERFGADSEQILDDPSSLEKQTKNILESKYKKENARIRKSAVRAIIYIFFTKTILAFVLELPYDMAILGKIYYPALFINVIFHPLLLFFITYTIKPLGEKNTTLIVSGLNTVIYENSMPSIQIRGRKNNNFLYFIFLILYGLIFLLSFGAIISVLYYKLNFNFMSMLLFTFFLTLVAYFGLRLRYIAKNWAVGSDKESSIYFLGNILVMPIVEVGRWLSQKFEGVNILVFIMDFIVETPFKVALSVFDSFISFLKEKREEMY